MRRFIYTTTLSALVASCLLFPVAASAQSISFSYGSPYYSGGHYGSGYSQPYGYNSYYGGSSTPYYGSYNSSPSYGYGYNRPYYGNYGSYYGSRSFGYHDTPRGGHFHVGPFRIR